MRSVASIILFMMIMSFNTNLYSQETLVKDVTFKATDDVVEIKLI